MHKDAEKSPPPAAKPAVSVVGRATTFTVSSAPARAKPRRNRAILHLHTQGRIRVPQSRREFLQGSSSPREKSRAPFSITPRNRDKYTAQMAEGMVHAAQFPPVPSLPSAKNGFPLPSGNFLACPRPPNSSIKAMRNSPPLATQECRRSLPTSLTGTESRKAPDGGATSLKLNDR